MERFRRFAKEYSFVLGYLAIAALLAAALRYILYRQMDDWLWGFLIGGGVAGVLFIVAWIWTRPAEAREVPGRVRGVLVRRSTRYGSNAVLMSAVFLAILILLNYLGGRYHTIIDATELKQYSLSPQSVQVLAEIDQPVTITGFFTGESSRLDFDRLLNQYLTHSSQLSYTVIDPDREPIKASQYENAPRTGLLIQSGERSEVVYLAEEQDITSALLKVTRTDKKVIYFLTGHRERDMSGDGDDGYSIVATSLRDQNYELRTLSLTITTTVPGDAAVVVIAGPQTTLLPEEIAQLQTYLTQGGKALIMQDPPIQYENLDSGLNEVLSAAWKVRFDDGVIVDLPSSLMGSEFVPVVGEYHYSQITRDMGGLATFFPLACTVEQIEQDSSGTLFFASLADTSEQSWAEQDTSSADVQFNEGVDLPGPLALIATVDSTSVSDTGASLNTRMVLIGDSDFASNGFVKSLGNEVLFLNAVNWLAEEESLIAIGPKSTEPRTVYLSRLQSTTILLVGVAIIPLVLLVIGIVVWWVRR